jgi:hypothetical protein
MSGDANAWPLPDFIASISEAAAAIVMIPYLLLIAFSFAIITQRMADFSS